MKIPYDKLIRDTIPEVLDNNKVPYEIKEAAFEERIEYLKKKLMEEVEEVVSAPRDEEGMELADVLEVVEAYAGELDMSFEDLRKLQKQKREERGGFEKFIILKWAEENN